MPQVALHEPHPGHEHAVLQQDTLLFKPDKHWALCADFAGILTILVSGP